MVLAILPSLSEDTGCAMARYKIQLSNQTEAGTFAPSDTLTVIPKQRKVSPTTIDNGISEGNRLETVNARLRRSRSLPGIAYDLSRRLSSKFVQPTVVRRPQVRPSLCSFPGSLLSSPTSPLDSTNPSSLQSRNVSTRDVSTAKTSFETSSFPLPGSKSSEKAPTPALTVVEELGSEDERESDVELMLPPEEPVHIIPQPTIRTVEAAANAKIFFETYYNPILAGKEAPRELRRQDLEVRLRALDNATEQYEQGLREWTLRETEHLRRLRVLKNQSERASREKQNPMALAGFEMVRVLGKGSFGVVRLVREKSEECRRDSVGGALKAFRRSTRQGAWDMVRSGVDWRKSFEFKNVGEVPQEGHAAKVNRRSHSTQDREDVQPGNESVLSDEIHRGSMVNQFKAFSRSTKRGALKILRSGTEGRRSSEHKNDSGPLPEVFAMKVIRKSDMIRNCQEGHLRAERDFLVASEKSRWVVPLIASFQDSSNLYLVMEYMIRGDFLGLLISKDRLEERKTQFYIAEMILCLEEAHRLKWIHRDVKPDNFLISSSGHLKISDFGLAFDGHWTHDQTYYHCQRYSLLKKLGVQIEGDHMDRDEMEKAAKDRDFSFYLTPKEQKARSRHGKTIVDENAKTQPILQWRNRYGRRALAKSIVGTSQYMAPEIILGQEYDSRCDWWSIGIILYEVSNPKHIFEYFFGH